MPKVNVNRQVIVLLTGLMLAKAVQAAMDVMARGKPVETAVWSIGPVEMVILVQVFMAFAGGMPHPEMLKQMGAGEFAYTWLYNSLNIIFQNLDKKYHPTPVTDTVQVQRTSTVSTHVEKTS